MVSGLENSDLRKTFGNVFPHLSEGFGAAGNLIRQSVCNMLAQLGSLFGLNLNEVACKILVFFTTKVEVFFFFW